MEIKWLKTFVVAAQCENFRKASELLYLTQPAVTKHIQRLEEYLQIPLFIRQGKSVILSAEGLRFLSTAKKILAVYEEEMNRFEGWKAGYIKQFTIAVAPQIASSILPNILKEFMLREPKIEVLVNIVNSYAVAEEIIKGHADIGLTRNFTTHPSLTCELIFEEPVVLVAPNSSEIESEKDIFQTHRLITHNHPVYWEDLLEEIKRYYPSIKTMQVNQIEVTKKFISEGLGTSYLPYSIVEKEIKENLLKVIQPEKVSPPLSQTFIVTKAITPEALSFIEFFGEQIN